MCEIIIVVLMSIKIASIAKEKGRNAAGYVVLFIAAWFGCEIIGAMIGVIINRGEATIVAIGFAFVGGLIGGVSAFALISLLPPVEDEEYHRPRRKRRRRIRDEDEYETERRPRRRDFDEDESYRDRFQSGRNRAADDRNEEDDEGTGYRRKRRSSEE